MSHFFGDGHWPVTVHCSTLKAQIKRTLWFHLMAHLARVEVYPILWVETKCGGCELTTEGQYPNSSISTTDSDHILTTCPSSTSSATAATNFPVSLRRWARVPPRQLRAGKSRVFLGGRKRRRRRKGVQPCTRPRYTWGQQRKMSSLKAGCDKKS